MSNLTRYYEKLRKEWNVSTTMERIMFEILIQLMFITEELTIMNERYER